MSQVRRLSLLMPGLCLQFWFGSFELNSTIQLQSYRSVLHCSTVQLGSLIKDLKISRIWGVQVDCTCRFCYHRGSVTIGRGNLIPVGNHLQKS
ncbi:hypothetical protein BJX70DRAFT_362753 [Aspergillus crustosus]